MTGFESLYGCFEGCTHWVSRTAEGLGAYSSIVRIVLWVWVLWIILFCVAFAVMLKLSASTAAISVSDGLVLTEGKNRIFQVSQDCIRL